VYNFIKIIATPFHTSLYLHHTISSSNLEYRLSAAAMVVLQTAPRSTAQRDALMVQMVQPKNNLQNNANRC
jgi:hypothetical protein